jgi:pimeloyl-ACP methyl ester carboxylesterase
MKIYCFSGLGADKRVFSELSLNYELIHINWISVEKNTTIEEYALQLSRSIDQTQEHIIMGVSFGGLIAMEVSKITKAKLIILISSAEIRSELKPLHRFAGKVQLTKLIPSFLIIPPTCLLALAFGTKRKQLLKEVLADSNPHFMKWAVHQLCTWQNVERGLNVLKISGDKDQLMQINKDAIVIKGGKHLMIMDCSEEVSTVVNERLERSIFKG